MENIGKYIKEHVMGGTKLYSKIHGPVKLLGVKVIEDGSNYMIIVKDPLNRTYSFDTYGRFVVNDSVTDDCMLVLPDGYIRSIDIGDLVLLSKNGTQKYAGKVCDTDKINYVKFNFGFDTSDCKLILDSFTVDNLESYDITPVEQIRLSQILHSLGFEYSDYLGDIRPLTSEECKQLNLFSTFTQVLVKNKMDDEWRINYFQGYKNDKFICMTGEYDICIPYSNYVKHLI